jgi:hypothetical protein
VFRTWHHAVWYNVTTVHSATLRMTAVLEFTSKHKNTYYVTTDESVQVTLVGHNIKTRLIAMFVTDLRTIFLKIIYISVYILTSYKLVQLYLRTVHQLPEFERPVTTLKPTTDCIVL